MAPYGAGSQRVSQIVKALESKPRLRSSVSFQNYLLQRILHQGITSHCCGYCAEQDFTRLPGNADGCFRCEGRGCLQGSHGKISRWVHRHVEGSIPTKNELILYCGRSALQILRKLLKTARLLWHGATVLRPDAYRLQVPIPLAQNGTQGYSGKPVINVQGCLHCRCDGGFVVVTCLLRSYSPAWGLGAKAFYSRGVPIHVKGQLRCRIVCWIIWREGAKRGYCSIKWVARNGFL